MGSISGRAWLVWAGALIAAVAVLPLLGGGSRLVGYTLRATFLIPALILGARLRNPRTRPRGMVTLGGPGGTRAELVALALLVSPIVIAIVLINVFGDATR